MLFLIGTGLSYYDISAGALEACRECELYQESYTSYFNEAKKEFIEGKLGKKITPLSRSDLEEEVKKIVEKAKIRDIAILTGGDPLIATTHKIILIEAKRHGIRTKIFHSSSIISAAMGESGLDFYRFGAVCTISRWSESYKPVSFYETIQKNISNNYHSIILLDYDPKEASSLGIREAIDILSKAEEKYKKGIINKTANIFIIQNLGLEGQSTYFTTISSAPLLKPVKGPSLMIIPARISDIEQEAIDSMH